MLDLKNTMIVKPGEHRIVAFIDLLGFKNALKEDRNFEKLLELLSFFVGHNRNYNEKQVGITIEGNKSYTIHPSIMAFSDSIIISYPLDGILPATAIFSELSEHIAFFALKALEHGFLIRGGMAQGRLYHSNGILMGCPFIEAHELEKKVSEDKKKGMPEVFVPRALAEQYNLDKPPSASRAGESPVELPELALLSPFVLENETIYSMNYIRHMLRQGVPTGNSWWNGINNRINEIKKVILVNKDIIKSDGVLDQYDREGILLKWDWFENKFEKEANLLLRYEPIEQK